MRSRTVGFLGGHRVAVALLVATVSALLLASGASASAPVLEFVAPGHAFPVTFTTESGAVTAELAGFESVVECAASTGEGKITGPHSTLSQYTFTGCKAEGTLNANCNSTGANTGEIVSEEIEAEPVYIDQAREEVGMLLDPEGNIYMKFECGGEQVEARGPFLAPASPVNKATTSFTATLSESLGVQLPNEYETSSGEKRLALPTGKRGTHEPASTGVEAAFTIHTAVPIEVRAITTGQMEAKQREEAEKARQAEAKRAEETIAKLRGEVAAGKHAEESLSAKLTALERRLKEEARRKREVLLASALKRCKREPARKRSQCRAQAEHKYGGTVRKGKASTTESRSRT
ncbi:MAG TPA: hypothetical protein VFR48_10755 [Solirubrobacteraceae bacterium]|nr:hypothetical protein [Solirubrobacteraceae bacterium]